MQVEEVTALAGKHNMVHVVSRDVDDTTVEMVFESVEKSDAHAFVTVLRLEGANVYGPWKYDRPGFNYTVSVNADTE